MINKEFAQNFVRKISKQLGYSVNVMDENAVIIASVEKSRIGDFHTGAYMMLKQNQNMQIVHEVGQDMIGVRAGVNLLIREHGIPVGVVGISGVPEEVIEPLKLVKLMFDTMLEYENSRQNRYMERKGGDDFIYALLFEKSGSSGRIHRLAKRIGYQESCPRVPLLIEFDYLVPLDNIVEQMIIKYKNLKAYDSQDIVCQLEPGRMLILKSISFKNLGEYKILLAECAEEIIEKGKQICNGVTSDRTSAYCGIPQAAFEDYASAYEEVNWLLEHYNKAGCSKIQFFQDYVGEYLSSQMVPKTEMDIIMDQMAELIKDTIGMDSFIETAAALVDSNMRVDEAGAKLFVHKNTVVYRIKKIKEALGIDPVNNAKDTVFFILLTSYCVRYRHAE